MTSYSHCYCYFVTWSGSTKRMRIRVHKGGYNFEKVSHFSKNFVLTRFRKRTQFVTQKFKILKTTLWIFPTGSGMSYLQGLPSFEGLHLEFVFVHSHLLISALAISTPLAEPYRVMVPFLKNKNSTYLNRKYRTYLSIIPICSHKHTGKV